MTETTRLTPRQRLTRGLTYTAVGPVDITRGTLGLGAQGIHSAGSSARQRYQASRVSDELAAAKEVVAGLPEALQEARRPKRKLPWLALAAVATLAGGAVAFSIIRRSMQPEPSPRPPSVEVTPKP